MRTVSVTVEDTLPILECRLQQHAEECALILVLSLTSYGKFYKNLCAVQAVGTLEKTNKQKKRFKVLNLY